MQKARRHPNGLRPLVSVRFQILFHSLVQGTFHLSLTVLVHYRSHRSIQPYRMVPADSHKISHVPRYSGYYSSLYDFTFTGLSPSMVILSSIFYFSIHEPMQSYNPNFAVTKLVWAIPSSLAATTGITIVFSSSGYLDVSVLRVSSLSSDYASHSRVAPFRNLRIRLQHHPEAYRSLSRLSSPLEAQASAQRS